MKSTSRQMEFYIFLVSHHHNFVFLFSTLVQHLGYESLFILILRPQDGVDKEDSGAFRYLPFWVEDESQGHVNACDNFINLLAKLLFECGQGSRETVHKKCNPPSIDLRYSEKFFSASSRGKSKTMSFRFAKRFKMESMKGTISPLVTKQ